MPKDLQMLLLDVVFWRCLCNDYVNKVPNYLLQQFLHYFTLF